MRASQLPNADCEREPPVLDAHARSAATKRRKRRAHAAVPRLSRVVAYSRAWLNERGMPFDDGAWLLRLESPTHDLPPIALPDDEALYCFLKVSQPEVFELCRAQDDMLDSSFSSATRA